MRKELRDYKFNKTTELLSEFSLFKLIRNMTTVTKLGAMVKLRWDNTHREDLEYLTHKTLNCVIKMEKS